MMLIKTYLAPDRYGGQGLFSHEDVQAKDVIFKFCFSKTRFISVNEYFSMDEAEKKDVEKHSYPCFAPHDDPPMIGLLLNLDNGKYMNHSDTPNTGHHPDNDELCIALRPIKQGEELTCNYNEFDPDDILFKIGVYSGKSFLSEMPAKNSCTL